MVRAVDLGEPNSRKSTAQVIVEVVERLKRSHNAPKFISPSITVSVLEDDKVGSLLDIVQAEDPDEDKLWYSIIDGDSLGQFAIGPEAGNLILAGRLDWEMISFYNLTLQVTDGIYTNTCNVVVKVLDKNDNWPLFRNSSYAASILESAPLGTSILQVEATDADMDSRLLYTFPDYANTKASLALFKIDPNTGEIFVKSALDREVLAEHNLTVMVQDQGTQPNRNYTRVTISILDDNDHPPEFLSSIFSGRIFETAAIGTSVVEVSAVDRDKGHNSQISYSIQSGNIGGVFAMESTLGVISVAKELDRSSKAEYELVVMAADKGQVPLSSTARAKISVTVSNNAPPKFLSSEYMAEVPENQPIGTNIISLSAECQSSVVYSIIHGSEGNHFAINPNSGVVHSSVVIDYEKMQFYNLTISATSIIHASTYTTLLIHVIDENDNAPNFSQSLYVGNISETAKPGTVVLTANKTALVVKAVDLDSGQNALLKYEIRDEHAKKFVTIDPSTGAIRTVGEFDHEVFHILEFTVEVCDMGKPQLRGLNPAKVVIHINDVNDTPPKFSKSEYSAIVLIPTYQDVVITQVSATDPDSGINTILKYSIKSGNEDGKFCIKQDTGEVFVQSEISAVRDYHLVLEVTDGLFRSQSILNISVQQSIDSGITFSKYIYKVSAKENDAEVRTLEVIQVSGRALNEQYTFRLLNGQEKFIIGRTSGVLKTTGKPLDREQLSLYRLVVEVTGETGKKAHAIVEVIVEDENDNAPMFINQPYHAVALKDLHLGGTVKQVSAIDRDFGRNAYVSYKLIERGDIDNKFAMDSATGKILLSRALVESDVGREITLSVEASDGGQPRHTVQTTVVVKIINKYYPLFERQVYKAEIPENAPAGAIVVDVEAISSTNQKLIYSIVHGDPYRDFWMDFSIGVITVKGQLDFEMTPSYNLTIQAMETLSGLSTSAIVLIQVTDVNDNKPIFDSLKYVGIVSEAATIGTMVSKVTAKDRDTGINGEVQYSLFSEKFGDKDINYFTVNSETGEITTNLFLDYDERSEFNFQVVAMDKGIPSLTSSVPVHFTVADLNDNAPIFDLPLYQCVISDLATRGQLVTKVSAHDLDTSSNGYFHYSIVSGNDKQTFHIDSLNGIVSLSEYRKPQLYSVYDLNVSVSDGVFTSYAKVGISVRNSNNYAPVFDQSIYVAEFPENYGVGMLVTSVSAIDKDAGTYGMLTYTIPSETLNAVFRVDADSGEIFSRQVLDREEQSSYEIPVAVTDNGGRMSFTKVHVTITDLNDNAPMFLAQSYKTNIFPNTTINSAILQVSAIDQDSGVNGAVQYLLSNPPGSKAAKYFSINLHTGIITLIHSVEDLENEVFQFFVRAVDMGEPYFESNVNVEILVMFKDDRPPSFSQDNFSYFILESDPVGTVIATVTADSQDSVEYLIIPGQTKSSNTPPMFAIDGKGRIQVANYLNHETTSSFVLTVRAQTLTVPPLIRETRVIVNLLDINDNCPVFESSSYSITVAEHAEIGTELIQVKAHDKDKAARLKYVFGHDIQEHSHMFGLDSATGMLTLLSPLDRETKSQYNITIFVLDTDDAKSLKNSTVVYVTVTDHNDNPPVFTRKKYQAAVNEDAYPGTIIMSVSTEDKDIGVNRDVMYFIMDGDELGRFQIQKNGEIFVNRELDRETTASYSLVVAATDGAFVSTATVVVDILDANDNSPVCGQAIHEKIVSEAASSSDIIHWMTATDADEAGTRNSQIHYQLIGENSDLFSLDSTSGILTSRGGLDREKQSFYKLIASAVDGGGKSCTTVIYISISDINDNAPEFDTPTAIVMVKEDVPVNSLVYRVSANDQDLGINGQILFYLKADGNGTFRIDARSGLVQVSKALDRETQSQYTLTIQATDQGTPHLTSEAILTVKVLDVNDNPPEFERTSYTAAIAEDAPVGKSVLTVRATSLDTGINAQITYSIVAGNDKKKFKIDQDSGVILTNDILDHEDASSFMLTIQAMDHGEEPLSNTVIVQINVTDVNDNPPVFSQSAYTAKVREDLKVGTKFLQLVATDADSTKKNTLITFSIESGDHLNNFVIGKEDGALLVNTPLDREAISTYVLHVRATNELFKTDTTVNIEVLDANDCPPRFSQDNYTVFVQMNFKKEDRDIGVHILQFTVNDDDLDPNGPPFTFDIVKGNAGGEFRVDGEGILRTASKLNRRLTATYQLTVRVFDNGAPALYSDMDVTVFVIEESTFAPEVNNLEVSISSYLDDFPGGVIGQIKAVDADVHDTLTYEVVSPNRRLFDIDKKDGRILAFAGLDSGQYVVNISISDGKYTTYGKVDIAVSTVTEDMITNAITIQFDSLSPDSFVKNYRKDFQRVLKRELSVRARDVEIISIQKSDVISEIENRARRSTSSYLDVLFAVKRNPDSYMKQIILRKKVQQAKDSIQDALNVRIVKIFSDICEPGLCDGGGQCVGYVEFDKDSLVPIFMESGSFVSAKHRYTYDCECPDGSIGETCLKNLTSCSQNPCPKYKICLPLSDVKFRCECPPGKTGKRCEKEIDNKCTTASCQKGDKPMTFSGQSYARWTLQESIENRLSLQLSIKTRKETANLMYVKGDKDYSILELVHGRIQYRFDCGSGEGLVIVPYIVSDGEWHTIIVERHGKQAEIFLDGKYSAITTAPGSNKNLDLNTKDVYFGAEVDVYQNGYRDIRKGFEGCMENIRIYNIRLPVSGSNAAALEQEFARIEFQCKDDEYPIHGNNVCSSFPCMNNGKCENTGLNSYICKCLDRYRGAKCEIDTDPCQESPCFNNGICTNIKGIPNEYHCTCTKEHMGRRCEYGQFCIPNPCIHGGSCIEGPSSYICMCRPGYGGTRCEQMVTTCRDNPCQNGGICQVTIEGLYYCNCTDEYRGHQCEDIRLPVITSNVAGINQSEIYVIVGVIGGMLFVVIIFVLVRYVRMRRREKQRRRNVNAGATNTETEVFLNSLKSDSNGFGSDKFIAKKPNRKNPPSPQPPPVPNRPASYTPSTHDSLNTLNNFDSARNYGSAAEELENCHNIPYNLDFLQTFSAPPPRSVASIAPSLPPPPPSNSASDSDSVQKAPWILDCQNILQHYADKHADKLAKSMPVGTVVPMSRYQGQGQDATSFNSLPISDTDDDLPGYHWDTSDWAPQKSLPNISEVPPQECPDSPGSSSRQSNDSNTHVFQGNRRLANNIPEYIDSEYVGDSEYAENEYEMEEMPCLPNYEELLAQQHQLHDDYQLPHHDFNIHPNHYLPEYNIHDQSAESENWLGLPSYNQTADSDQSAEDDTDSVIHYGFPQRRNVENRLSVLTADSDFTAQNRLSTAYTTDSEWNGENYRTSMIESTDNMSVSAEGLTSANDSVSDISGLCEIEDSEINVSDDDVGDEPDETNALMAKLHS
ncbi:hypothetical protein CHS0354_040047 [Potamilus streckersoni]|uniref:Protocadherin Fat 4 n=1 Tax=Potamilus streckersoni TaxID=2493646 RepID=A0AAE0W1H5_9BIVA|nr:hypothetical protein CHS0354_040047 [Potamilus streckersoni]